jgi:hypothetical protein
MLKQPGQICGNTICCMQDIKTPYYVWNIFRGTIEEPLIIYSMSYCNICKRKKKFPLPDWKCDGSYLCCKNDEVPFVEYTFKDYSICLRKCRYCGKETWHTY